VFVVGYFGDWRRAAAVLFERHSLQGHPAPSREKGQEVAGTIAARFGISRNNHEECVAQTLLARRGGFDIETETPVISAALATTQFGCVAGSLTARYDSSPCADRGMNVVAQPIGFNARQDPCSSENLIGSIDTDGCTQAVMQSMAVRRLTPVECERLQGFPDNYTNIPKAADGPRYKALGNSMAVPVMRWIGKRIQMVEA
jgi:DNA (cytosine-5)-methyltransferase 1